MTVPDDAAVQAATASGGPLRRVVAALQGGAHSRAALARLTGLDREVVDAALDHLTRLGRVRAELLGSVCPQPGCGSCPSGRADGAPGCGAPAPASAQGPVALTLLPRRPR